MKLTQEFKQEVEEQYSEVTEDLVKFAKLLGAEEYSLEALTFIQETVNNSIKKAIEEIKNVK